MQDLKYDMTIEIMAMNQPTGPDDVIKAAVTGDTAWETDETYFIEPVYFMLGLTESAMSLIARINHAAFETHGASSLVTLNYETVDANDVVALLYAGFRKALGLKMQDMLAASLLVGARDFLSDYGEKYCKLFKCAAKVTAVWTPDGTRTCSWYSPDGKLNRNVKGIKGEPSQSLDDFITEWDKAR